MKRYLALFIIIGFMVAGSIVYFLHDSTYNILAHTECFEMGKISKLDKFGNGYMVSCFDLNLFGK